MMQKLKLLVLLLLGSVQLVFAQSKTVSGTVSDNDGQPLPGVTVMVVGTTTGTVTDFNGIYKLTAQPETQLQFSFIGFINQTVTVADKSEINITLLPDVEELDEVVVVGYGTQKKESVVGAIAQTQSEDIVRSTKGADLVNGMAGLMPGVIVIQTSGARGGAMIGTEGEDNSDILIRGLSTWNNSGPLVLIDGIERDMRTIDPLEIESISVLKDASATAVFGVRGANGVILITTKRGSESKPKLSFDMNAAIESISRIPRTLGSYEALKLRNYAVLQASPTAQDAWSFYTPDEILEYYRTGQYPELYADTNWEELMTNKNAWTQKYNMNIKGGTKFVKYFASLGYLSQSDLLNTEDLGTGYDPEFKYSRFNFRSNLDFEITKTTKFSVNLQGVYGMRQQPAGGVVQNQSLFRGVFKKPHDLPIPVYSDGTFGDSGGQYERFGSNPYADLNMWGIDKETKTEVNIDLAFVQDLDKFVKGLKFSAKLANDTRSVTVGPNISEEGYTTKYINPAILTGNPQNAADSAKYIIYTTPDAGAQHGYYYTDKPYNMNSESSTAGQVYRHTYYNAALNYNRYFGIHSVTSMALINVDESALGSAYPTRRLEYVGRVTYNYDSRYLLEANGSITGVNKFGPDYRYDDFYSAAAGWVISNEKFFKDNIKAVNNFKVRYSWGTVGNDRVNLGSVQYPYLSIPNLTNKYATFLTEAGTVVNSAYSANLEGSIGNPALRWETAVKNNVGVELGLFDNLISGTFDYFTEHRSDMLVPSDQRLNADFVGAQNPPDNVGETKMRGYEVDVKFTKKLNEVNTWLRFSHTNSKDEIIYKEDPELRPDYQKLAGHQISQIYTIMHSGIVQNWDQLYTGVNSTDKTKFLPGDYRMVDFNGDGVIDNNDGALFGYPARPQKTYSASMGLEWKNFSCMVLFYGTYNVSKNYALGEYDFNSPLIYAQQRDEGWIPELGQTTNALYRAPRLSGTPTGNYWIWDASMLRLKNMEIAYTFSKNRLQSLKIDGLRLFINGNNLWLWTDLPEDREGASNDVENYPLTKSINFGATIDF
jgi:TonB-linked SusC/RagA family outer membrane protein